MALAAPPPAGMTDPTQRRFRGAARISEYEVMKEKLGEGTFGVVSKGVSKRSGKVFALKKILMHNEKDGFPITALREVKLLKMLSHPNILRLEEMAVERQSADDKGKNGKKRATLYMVSPYADHDLSGMLTNPDIRFQESQIKCYMQQLLEGLRYLHDSHILHRDMKAANILISNTGVLQIADFGLARHYEGPTPQPGKGNGEAVRDYTSLVVTRWYRPPELLLTLKKYTPAIDMWGVGCVFGEMFERKPILEGRTDVDQCVRIFKLVGSPNESNMPGWSSLPGCEGHKEWEQRKGDIDQRFGQHLKPEGLDLLKSLLCLDYKKRVNAIDALQHPYFKTAPLPARPEDLPRYQDSHELDARRRGQEKKMNLPPAPAGGTVGMGPDEWNPQGGPYGGNGYHNGPNYPRDRGPPRRYDDRRGPPPPDSSRQPHWRQDRDNRARMPPAANGHGLPPPPADLPRRPDMRNGPPPPPGSRGPPAGGPNVDTYIPSYAGGRGSREGSYRDPDAVPPPPSRGYRDDPYRERERERGPLPGYDRARRTRSRSPEQEDMRRARLQNRERDFYGR
ncbi:hypothetical protein WHR41_06383 [Cladosporium halotolerans]|uniref:Protein kinase domain-containing protein n=1 Tax=Cladosporium halotolerans TaxID=1052096 RepID=A0AB34KHN1_9PEZI